MAKQVGMEFAFFEFLRPGILTRFSGEKLILSGK